MTPFANPRKLAKSLTKIPMGQAKMGAISLFPMNTFTGDANEVGSPLKISVSKPVSTGAKSKGSRAKPRSRTNFSEMFENPGTTKSHRISKKFVSLGPVNIDTPGVSMTPGSKIPSGDFDGLEGYMPKSIVGNNLKKDFEEKATIISNREILVSVD